MSLEPEKVPDPESLDALRALSDDLARSSRSPNTQRAYESAWGEFERWAIENQFPALPASPGTVGIYLARLVAKGRKTGTIQSALVAISQRHLDGGYPSPRNDPNVRRVIAGVRRRLGSRQDRKAPVTREQVDEMIKALGTDLRGLRDRAILAIGFATGMRRSELVALRVSDLQFGEADLVITIRRSKWSPAARRVRAAALGGPACPLASIRAWLDAAGLVEGGVFRKVTARGAIGPSALQDGAVGRLVKAVAVRVGLDPRSVAAHSLRAGYATASIRDGVSPARIQRTLGHATPAMTLRYVHEAEVEGDDRAFHPGSTR